MAVVEDLRDCRVKYLDHETVEISTRGHQQLEKNLKENR